MNKILYVEDDKRTRDITLVILGRLFDEIRFASDGHEALEIFKEFKPGIVVTDIEMPNMDGVELINCIYEIQPDTKIIVTSAYDRQECSCPEVATYIKKPLRKKDLLNALGVNNKTDLS